MIVRVRIIVDVKENSIMSQIVESLIQKRRRTWRNNIFDFFILSGLTMNLIVIGWLVGYWALH